MAGSPSNTVELFASPLSSPMPEVTPPTSSVSQKKVNFYILLPRLSARKKQLYKPLDEVPLVAELMEIIGEYKDDGKLFYFARYGDDLAHKFPAQPLSRTYPKLVVEYCRKKADGDSPSFDPAAPYVHPTSRIEKQITVKLKNASAANGVESRTSDSEDMYLDFSGESELGSEDYTDRSYRQQTRTTRRSTRRTRELPFSPRKSRLRKIYTIDYSDESDYEAQTAVRRSTHRKPVKVAIRLEDSSGLSDENDARESSSFRRNARPKKERRRRAVQPGYGMVHDASDIENDSGDELDELAILKRHRHICEKCHERAAHILLREPNAKKQRKARSARTKDEFEESEDETTRLKALGGWVRCLKCPVVAHWKCLSSAQRDEILKAIREKSLPEQETAQDVPEKAQKRSELDVHEGADFVCGACTKGGICIGCLKPTTAPLGATDTSGLGVSSAVQPDMQPDRSQQHLLFRCFTCRRPAHYEHLPRPQSLPEDSSVAEIAEYCQNEKEWLCADCSSYIYSLDKILAWCPYPPNAMESPGEAPNYKDPLPREYLVKWVGRSYRRTQWVPHMWLLSTSRTKLKNFVNGGPRVQLKHDNKRSRMQEPADISETPDIPDPALPGPLSLDAFPDAEQHIPPAWKTIDRILDVLLWRPDSKGRNRSQSDSHAEIIEPKLTAEYAAIFENGKEPSSRHTETVLQWQARNRKISSGDIDQVVWVFVKWSELTYDEATWDSPPRKDEPGYDSFVRAFARYVESLEVKIPKFSISEVKQFEARPKDNYRHHVLKKAADLQLGQAPELQLLPFQVDGFNWLCNNWYNRQPCILADEMGLGKTVQIATFLGSIFDKFKAIPALVVVPNSTIANWVRELERWAPNLRVVPFYGEAKAREIIRKFELHHEKPPKSCTRAKFHVLVVTYEALLGKGDFSPVFKSEPRWEVLIVDEGQRLKNDNSLLFRKLNELNSRHRIIMTGTPLNNNIRELFNLMNFLDPGNWDDLDALEKEYEELTEDLVKQLHNKLRPYFLRRIKSEVLELPPKNEVIVPVSMAPLQREVYRSILSKNVDILKGLTHVANTRSNVTKKNVHNILMQLRKCLQHPYLYDNDIEPRELPPNEIHEKLIDASAKLRLLRALLPKLKSRGHRILLFSQFVIALDVIEDFLQGEGHKFLRLDGNTNTSERQKGMDEFNRPGSDVFVYLLTTRAGGVGINLYTADTVIIFDPDFNPHQDLQAISRAYRYGQQKTCLVFKLMVKDSAEERIMQIGKKKLVLDHLIVQKMDDDDAAGEDVQSILTFGANALFEANQESRDIIYTDQDIDKLIEKTEQQGDKLEEVKEGPLSFPFAKIWTADKETMEEIQDDDQGDSWTQTLQKITAEQDKLREQEVVVAGRGVRRAATHKPNYIYDANDGPAGKGKKKIKGQPTVSDSSSYTGSDNESDAESESPMAVDLQSDLQSIVDKKAHRMKNSSLNAPDTNGMPSKQINLSASAIDPAACGLCGQVHGAGLGECFMTEKSVYLAEYREMLILYADDEPWELRNVAIRAIDEALHKRGHLSLIAGQPLHPLRKPSLQASSSSSLKRSASPTGQAAKKRPKPGLSRPTCPICNQSPYHLVKDCPVVREGPESIAKQIRRLEGTIDVAMIQTVDILRNILNKQKKRDGQ